MTNLSHVNGLSFLHCMHQRLETLQTQLTLTYTVNTHSDPADTINSNLHSEHPSETHILEKMTMNDLGRQRLD